MFVALIFLVASLALSVGFAAGAGWATLNRSDDDEPTVTLRSRVDREIDWFLSH